MRASLLLCLFAVVGCSGESNVPANDSKKAEFSLTVEEIFYIKPPVDRVILVGTIKEGSVLPGDSLVVKCKDGDVPVVVETIERPSGPIAKAEKGDQVGLKLAGIRKEQPSQGDRIVR
jgi:translation elongation factor EF-1alpha